MSRADDRFHCPRCATTVPVEGPGPLDRLRFGAVLLSVVSLLCGAPMLGTGLIFSAPLLMVIGIGVGPAVRDAFAPTCCAHCGCEVRPVAEVERSAAASRVLAAR